MKRVIPILAIALATLAMTAVLAGADPIHVGGSNFTTSSSPIHVGGSSFLYRVPDRVGGLVSSNSPLYGGGGATTTCSPIHVGGS